MVYLKCFGVLRWPNCFIKIRFRVNGLPLMSWLSFQQIAFHRKSIYSIKIECFFFIKYEGPLHLFLYILHIWNLQFFFSPLLPYRFMIPFCFSKIISLTFIIKRVTIFTVSIYCFLKFSTSVSLFSNWSHLHFNVVFYLFIFTYTFLHLW